MSDDHWERRDAMMREAVRRARDCARAGVRPSGIVREVIPFFEACNYSVSSVLLISLGREAFGLTISEGKDTPGFTVSEISDAAAFDAYLAPLIERNRAQWDVDDAARCVLTVKIDRARALDDAKALIGYAKRAADGRVLVLDSWGTHSYDYVSFTTPEPAAGWARLQALYDDSVLGRALAASSIVVCQGVRRWDDHQLLYHHDASVKVNAL